MAVNHYENFPVASFLLPSRLRPAVRALYTFARSADDIADEGDAGHEQRIADLVRYETQLGVEQQVTIVGVDEFDPLRGKISWVSPVARALNKAHEGDTVRLQTPSGIDELTLLEVTYPA